MSNLDNLISKILSDCEEKAAQITGESTQKASALIAEGSSAAEKEKEKILADANLEAKKQAEQIVVGKRLEIRDSHLSAKRQVVNKVFERALETLNNMPKDEFMGFLVKSLDKMSPNGEEIILPSKYNIDVKELNSKLKNGSVKKHEGTRDIDGGFILLKEGIENNNAFDTLLDYYRDELEGDIIAALY